MSGSLPSLGLIGMTSGISQLSPVLLSFGNQILIVRVTWSLCLLKKFEKYEKGKQGGYYFDTVIYIKFNMWLTL
jgi:hypothetical protein